MLRIKEVAQEKGYSMQELAQKLGITPETLTRQASSKGNPTKNTLEKIAGALGVEIVDLFEVRQATKANFIICPHCMREISIEVKP